MTGLQTLLASNFVPSVVKDVAEGFVFNLATGFNAMSNLPSVSD